MPTVEAQGLTLVLECARWQLLGQEGGVTGGRGVPWGQWQWRVAQPWSIGETVSAA